MQRMQSRSEREKFEQLEFLREVDKNFRRLAALEPERFALIDASREAKDVARLALEPVLELIRCRSVF
jgi:dTMP kinase